MFETTKNTEYLEDLFKFLKVVEGFSALPYNDHAKEDGSGFLTIGYGANLQVKKWLIATLNELRLFGDVIELKSKEDIEDLDNKANKAKIDEFYSITQKEVTDNNISTIRTQLNELLRQYTRQSSFKLTKEQAIKVKKIASDSIFDYTSTINDRTLKMDKETNEYAGILSYAFNVGNDSRKYFFDACNKDKDNRFLAFFTLRYGVNFSLNYKHDDKDKDKSSYQKIFENSNVYGIAKRRFWESQLFGFEYNENNSFKFAMGIFKILNFKYTHRKGYSEYYVIDFKNERPNKTYLDWIIKYEDELLYAKKSQKQTWQEFYNADAKANNLAEKFRNIQGINPNEDNFLHPYLAYINQTFAKGTISEYALSNIYVIQAIKDCEKLNIALAKRNDSKDLTPLLIICLKPNMHQENIDTYSIKQPSNTFLSIVVFEGAKLDMSKIDTKKSEIIYARLQNENNQDENNIEAMLLQGSSRSMILDSTANTLAIKADSNETYIFDKAKIATQDSKISPILKVYMNKEANPNDYIEIHNFAKENIDESNDYILGNDCKERYSGITLFLNQATTPHNTNCSNEGNFQVIVQNLNQYGLIEGDTLYLYSCENRKEISATIDDDYSATFNITLDLPKQTEVSKKTLSSHIILKTKPMRSTESIQEQKICSNPNFQINKSAKLARLYIITDAKLNTQKQPIEKREATQLRVKGIGYREKYLHYSINSNVRLKAIYNLKNPPQDKTNQTKWAYIITDKQTPPTQKQLNEKQYKHFLQNNSNEAYIGEKLEFQIQKEWLDINKIQYLYIYAYLNTPSTKVYLCIAIQYPLSLRFNGKELQILEWGEVKRDSVDSKQYDKQRIFTARSGKPLISNQDSTTQHNRDSLILNPDNTQEYFDYSKQRQKDKDIGAIPEGIYYIDISQSTDDKPSGIRTYNNTWYSLSRSKEGEKQWGKYNIPIYTDKDCTNTTESSTKRQGFYIHGGESYGDNGGIDLSKEDTRFFQVLEAIKEEYKEVLEYIKDDKGRIVVKLEVGYEERKSEIDLREKSGGKVRWFSQFEPPVPDYGNAACFRASKYTVQQAGIKDISGPYEKTLQIAKEVKKANTQTGYLSIDILKAKQAVKYIDEQLENACPIVVGVDHTYGNAYNADKTTDHFVVIVGRKYDEKGKLYYLFYEVGTHSINERNYQWGTSDSNKLYIQSNFVLSGQTQIGSKKNYIVTQVRVNIN